MNKKILILFSVATLIVIGLVLFLSQPPETNADSQDNVFGFACAWAPRATPLEESGLGWISFNSSNCDSSPQNGRSDGIPIGCPLEGTVMESYGVNIEDAGNLTGYAYYNMDDPNTPEKEIGWINFDPSLTGRPGPPNRTATVDLVGNVCGGIGYACGWARVIGYDGSWEGWIKLRKNNSDSGADYGVYVDIISGDFHGWAWGSDVMGWISFNCDNPEGGSVCSASDYKVQTSFPFAETGPTTSDLIVDTNSTSYCGSTIKQGRIGVSWLYNGDYPQEEYQIQVATNQNFGGATLIIDSTISQTINPGSRGSSGFDVVPSRRDGELEFEYNGTYWSRVKVKDDQGTWSANWSNPAITFSTPEHAYPSPDFDWTPKKSIIDEPVIIINNSKCFDINNNETSCSGWNWTIPSDASFVATSTAADFQPDIEFSSVGNNSVTLRVLDASLGANGYCDITQVVEIRLSPIDWEEILPY